MIGISAKTFDLDGSKYLGLTDIYFGDSGFRDVSRRSTRTATIDGGVSLYDTGYTAGDRTFLVVTEATAANVDFFTRLTKNYSEILITTEEGALNAHPKGVRLRSGKVTLTLQILSEAS